VNAFFFSHDFFLSLLSVAHTPLLELPDDVVNLPGFCNGSEYSTVVFMELQAIAPTQQIWHFLTSLLCDCHRLTSRAESSKMIIMGS
jgi:hypothetical protein